MKPEENNLEKNISRLVKQAGGKNEPTKAFTDSLIEQATAELEQGRIRTRKQRSTVMSIKKLLAYAAAVLVVCGVLVVLTMPRLYRAKEYSGPVAKGPAPEQPQVQAARQLDEKETKGEMSSSPVEYTQQVRTIVSDESGKFAQKPQAAPADALVVSSADRVKYARTSAVEDAVKLGIAGPADKSLSERSLNSAYAPTRPSGVVQCFPLPGEPARRYPMAHGGTTPPNGEDVDAMFFKNYGVNPFVDTEDDHLSTFATDVDTGSYTVVRGYLHDGHLPPNDAVRVEEFVNYFKYGYPAPQGDDFAVYMEAAPWTFGEGRKNSQLLRIGLKARQISDENRRPAVLTFVIDVSGSMGREDRLGLVKKSLRMLVENLRPDDKIGIAVYGSRGRKLMDHKALDEKSDILAAIESLSPSGSTYAEEGIRIGYEMAEKAFKQGRINRVILCSDGVANVGQTGADDILKIIREKAEKGITLSAVGFGMGNYNDVLMEQLGDKGNGYYAYVDTITEAKRLFEDNLTGTLEVVAKDVKVQVDFNPDVVRSYRLIGYENRDVPDDKFRDDKYDGGEIGAGHSTTALYELKLWPKKKGTIATTFVRYKAPQTDDVTEFKSFIATTDLKDSFDDSSKQFRLAATAAEFAEILRESYWAKGATLEPVLKNAQRLAEAFEGDADVIELADLVSKAGQFRQPQLEQSEIEYIE